MHHIQFPFHCLHDISNLDYTAYLNLFFISVVRLLFGKLPQNPSLKRCYSSALFRLCSVNWLLSIHPIIHTIMVSKNYLHFTVTLHINLTKIIFGNYTFIRNINTLIYSYILNSTDGKIMMRNYIRNLFLSSPCISNFV